MFLWPNRPPKDGKDHTYWSLVGTVRHGRRSTPENTVADTDPAITLSMGPEPRVGFRTTSSARSSASAPSTISPKPDGLFPFVPIAEQHTGRIYAQAHFFFPPAVQARVKEQEALRPSRRLP